MGQVLIGSLNENYTATDYSDGKTPPLGYVYAAADGKKYIFVKNTGATAIAAKKCAKVTSLANKEVQINATLAGNLFAGIRPSGADSLAQNEYGYLQIAGRTTGMFGDSARAIAAAGDSVVMDDDADGGNVGAHDEDVSATVNETTVEATTDSLKSIIGKANAAVNTTDADVDFTINPAANAWGI